MGMSPFLNSKVWALGKRSSDRERERLPIANNNHSQNVPGNTGFAFSIISPGLGEGYQWLATWFWGAERLSPTSKPSLAKIFPGKVELHFLLSIFSLKSIHPGKPCSRNISRFRKSVGRTP